MKSRPTFQRRVAWAISGFALGYAFIYGLCLADALTIDHFEVLHGGPRPTSIVGWIAFQHAFESVFVLAGGIGAILTFTASFARRRRDTVE